MPSSASLPGQKASLKITACEVSGPAVKPLSSPSSSVSLLINPAELKWQRKIALGGCRPMGDAGTGRKFNRIEPDTLSFTVTFDGTGAAANTGLSLLPKDVEGQIAALINIVYVYNGQKHEPNIVQIVWGSLLFTGHLTSFDIDYTLFRPSGVPLRAKGAMAFQGYKTAQEESRGKGASSPDLSHRVLVRDGDTLPLLCQRIYGDTRYYADVARFNGLRSFRSLPPGMLLHFPPLE